MISFQSLTSSSQSLSSLYERIGGNSEPTPRISSSSFNIGRYYEASTFALGTELRVHSSSERNELRSMATAQTMLTLADNGLAAMRPIIERMQSLAEKSSSALRTSQERAFLNQQFVQLRESVNRIALETQFNGINLLNGQHNSTSNSSSSARRGQTITGTSAAETLLGGYFSDTITGGQGNDVLIGNGGDDVFMDGANTVLLGSNVQIYTSAVNINNLAHAESLVLTQPVAGRFQSTEINYNDTSGSVANFLQHDAASLDNATLGAQWMDRMIYVFEGYLNVATAGTFNIDVASDDGFNLKINGSTAIQHANNRSWGTTAGTIALTAGMHSFRLLYWENGGSEGLRFRTNIEGAGMRAVDDNIMFTTPSTLDGNDTFNGTEFGNDTVVFTGNQSDYTITQLSDRIFEVRDNRAGSLNGTNILRDINVARFNDGDHTLFTHNSPAITFQFNDRTGDEFSFQVVDATSGALFERSDMSIATQAGATQAYSDLTHALNRLSDKQGYIVGKKAEAFALSSGKSKSFITKTNANTKMMHADLPRAASEFRDYFGSSNGRTLIEAQMGRSHQDALTRLLMSSLLR